MPKYVALIRLSQRIDGATTVGREHLVSRLDGPVDHVDVMGVTASSPLIEPSIPGCEQHGNCFANRQLTLTSKGAFN